MDPKLLSSYEAPQRAPVFLDRRPTPKVTRPTWPLLIYGALLGVSIVGAAAVALLNIGH